MAVINPTNADQGEAVASKMDGKTITAKVTYGT